MFEEEKEITQETAETPSEPVEDWQGKYTNLESQYKNLQRELNKARQTRLDPDALAEKVIERIAPAFDAIYSRDEDEEEPKRKPRPSELLKAAKPQETQTQSDPLFLFKDAQAQELMQDLGYSEAETRAFVREYPEVDEGLTELRKRHGAKLRKEAADEALQTFRQQQKASGATKGDGAPSAPSSPEPIKQGDWDSARAKARTPADLMKEYEGRI